MSSQIAGVIVENTFLSLPKLVPHIMPYLAPFMFLLHQRWPSEDKVQTFPSTLPVLFLSGSDDELIPPFHVAELCRLSGGKNRLVKFPNGTHSSSLLFQLLQRVRCSRSDRRRYLHAARLLPDNRPLHRGNHSITKYQRSSAASPLLSYFASPVNSSFIDRRILRVRRRGRG